MNIYVRETSEIRYLVYYSTVMSPYQTTNIIKYNSLVNNTCRKDKCNENLILEHRLVDNTLNLLRKHGRNVNLVSL